LTDLFYEYRELFEEIVNILLKNDYFLNESGSAKGARIVCYSDLPKKYFSESDWEIIVNCFQVVKPDDIKRYYDDEVRFNFAPSRSTLLFSMFPEIEVEAHDLLWFPPYFSSYAFITATQFDYMIEPLGDGWFICSWYEDEHGMKERDYIYDDKGFARRTDYNWEDAYNSD
jgi:hypothetical protein